MAQVKSNKAAKVKQNGVEAALKMLREVAPA